MALKINYIFLLLLSFFNYILSQSDYTEIELQDEDRKIYIDDSRRVESCLCGVTAGVCDYKCCCDEDCNTNQKEYMKNHNMCSDTGKANNYYIFLILY